MDWTQMKSEVDIYIYNHLKQSCHFDEKWASYEHSKSDDIGFKKGLNRVKFDFALKKGLPTPMFLQHNIEISNDRGPP